MRQLLLVSLGFAVLWGCARASGSVLGKDPGDGSPRAIRDLKPNDQALLTGTMIEKCPTAGCWFMLKDSTGVVRVDTKSAGFTVTDVAVNSKVTVRGSVKGGSERIVVASGMRY